MSLVQLGSENILECFVNMYINNSWIYLDLSICYFEDFSGSWGWLTSCFSFWTLNPANHLT